MNTVRAKFKCTEITKRSWAPKGGTVILSPVTANDANPENKAFWNATPSGKIEMGIENEAGFAAFELNREYYVDFIPVVPAVA